jgi:methionyl-tRNA formyltransferase
VAQTTLATETLRIWSAHARQDAADADVEPIPGRVVAAHRDGIDVATGSGLLRISSLQAPGKRPMPALDFINARNLDGARLA